MPHLLELPTELLEQILDEVMWDDGPRFLAEEPRFHEATNIALSCRRLYPIAIPYAYLACRVKFVNRRKDKDPKKYLTFLCPYGSLMGKCDPLHFDVYKRYGKFVRDLGIECLINGINGIQKQWKEFEDLKMTIPSRLESVVSSFNNLRTVSLGYGSYDPISAEDFMYTLRTITTTCLSLKELDIYVSKASFRANKDRYFDLELLEDTEADAPSNYASLDTVKLDLRLRDRSDLYLGFLMITGRVLHHSLLSVKKLWITTSFRYESTHFHVDFHLLVLFNHLGLKKVIRGFWELPSLEKLVCTNGQKALELFNDYLSGRAMGVKELTIGEFNETFEHYAVPGMASTFPQLRKLRLEPFNYRSERPLERIFELKRYLPSLQELEVEVFAEIFTEDPLRQVIMDTYGEDYHGRVAEYGDDKWKATFSL
ncbi:hypothetical protein H072_8448 [Dactylellina haptotyla CBS 200.50]|uniref:Uncharacterized protein n=1 Tax=Dactylellina haptotyla (strain CBS 200.50) TaxID=1284197 RepID=S8A4S8_DACHA|nr:hypothetical protein H072_8448 [Dactylellina haptotyla CBS 200.50]